MAETIVWADPDGTETVLTDVDGSNVDIEYGVEGRFAAPVVFSDEIVPLQDGSRLRSTRYGTREFVLPISVETASPSALRTRLRELLRTFDPKRGNGTLKATAPDATQREITCRYAGGLEVVEQLPMHVVGWQRAMLVFRAFDPYWYDVNETVATYTTGEAATFFPFFPLRLSGSEVFADATVTNDGDVDAWPTWTITGPGVNPVLRNLTSGKLISLTRTLAAGESIAIDTRPGKKTVKLNDDTNLYSTMSATSSLWPLLQGSNAVRVEMSAATSVSSVVLSYKRRWLGA